MERSGEKIKTAAAYDARGHEVKPEPGGMSTVDSHVFVLRTRDFDQEFKYHEVIKLSSDLTEAMFALFLFSGKFHPFNALSPCLSRSSCVECMDQVGLEPHLLIYNLPFIVEFYILIEKILDI